MAPASSSKSAHQSNTGRKKKLPPSFPHLPPAQAKKLKQAWIEKKKLKRAYFVQLRKEGGKVATAPATISEDPNEEVSEEEEIESKRREEKQSDGSQEEDEDEDEDEVVDEEIAERAKWKPAESGAPQTQSSRGNARGRGTAHQRAMGDNAPNHSRRRALEESKPNPAAIRDLAKEAYSRSSLHTYKSDPLHRRADRGRGAGRCSGSRGRGQPDMKKRMNVILAKLQSGV